MALLSRRRYLHIFPWTYTAIKWCVCVCECAVPKEAHIAICHCRRALVVIRLKSMRWQSHTHVANATIDDFNIGVKQGRGGLKGGWLGTFC